jgi:hypothetical protein
VIIAKYTAPLQVVETEEMRARIVAIATQEKISQAQVIREILAAGIEERERQGAGLGSDPGLRAS